MTLHVCVFYLTGCFCRFWKKTGRAGKGRRAFLSNSHLKRVSFHGFRGSHGSHGSHGSRGHQAVGFVGSYQRKRDKDGLPS